MINKWILFGVVLLLFNALYFLMTRPTDTISHGETVSFGNHLAGSGEIVVFQFTANWCGPCRKARPYVRKLVSQYSNVHYKLIDIVSWESAAARQMRDSFGGRSIPFFVVYNSSGSCLVAGDVHAMTNVVKGYGKLRQAPEA